MSKCPDASVCETLIDRVLDTHTYSTGREVVGDLVKLKLIYLAKETSDSDSANYGNLTCLHGPLECKANVQQLCAAKHWSRPTTSNSTRDLKGTLAEKAHGEWKTWWNFVQCMNYGKRERIGELSTAKACAKVVGKEWTKELEECSESGDTSEGAKLFRKSYELSRELEIQKSCTIVLNSRKICVHDGTWKDCEGGHEVGDFVKQIKDEHKKINTPVQFDVPKSPATQVGDVEEEWVVV